MVFRTTSSAVELRKTICTASQVSTAYRPSPPVRTRRRRPAVRSTRTATVSFLGGGAATVIVEDYEHAVKRGAPIIAEVVGWGFSGNGDHISTPTVEGPARSLKHCLDNSGIKDIHEIGYVNAHATSTHVGDSREALAIAQNFGDYRVPVTSTKSQTGHEMWMAVPAR